MAFYSVTFKREEVTFLVEADDIHESIEKGKLEFEHCDLGSYIYVEEVTVRRQNQEGGDVE